MNARILSWDKPGSGFLFNLTYSEKCREWPYFKAFETLLGKKVGLLSY